MCSADRTFGVTEPYGRTERRRQRPARHRRRRSPGRRGHPKLRGERRQGRRVLVELRRPARIRATGRGPGQGGGSTCGAPMDIARRSFAGQRPELFAETAGAQSAVSGWRPDHTARTRSGATGPKAGGEPGTRPGSRTGRVRAGWPALRWGTSVGLMGVNVSPAYDPMFAFAHRLLIIAPPTGSNARGKGNKGPTGHGRGAP